MEQEAIPRVRGQRRKDPRLMETAGSPLGRVSGRGRGVRSVWEASETRSVLAWGAITPKSCPCLADGEAEAQGWSLLCGDITALVMRTSGPMPFLPPPLFLPVLRPLEGLPYRGLWLLAWAQRPIHGAVAPWHGTRDPNGWGL